MVKNMCSHAFCADSDRSATLSYTNTFILKSSPYPFLPHLLLIIFILLLLNFDQKISSILECQTNFSEDLIRGWDLAW